MNLQHFAGLSHTALIDMIASGNIMPSPNDTVIGKRKPILIDKNIYGGGRSLERTGLCEDRRQD